MLLKKEQHKLLECLPGSTSLTHFLFGARVTSSFCSCRSRLGRASYVSEDLLTGPDAGATAVSVWLRGVFTALDSLLRAPSSGKA